LMTVFIPFAFTSFYNPLRWLDTFPARGPYSLALKRDYRLGEEEDV
jgi:hypothetical protein